METFSQKLKKNYEEACRKNKKQYSLYHCATSNGITERVLDLNSEYVFLPPGYSGRKKNEIKEYKLAAFMVREALKDENHLLPIKGKRWELIDAERNFAKEDLSGIGKGKRLDLLAYEKETNSYILLELKIKRSLNKADEELLSYTSTIQENIDKANEFYSVQVEKKNVKGYIVWPSAQSPREYDKPWGLIEYAKDKLDDIENLKLDIITEPS